MNHQEIFVEQFQSPVGALQISTSSDKLISVLFIEAKTKPMIAAEITTNNPAIMQQTILQLQEYFEGKRKIFDMPIEMNGTDFQKTVWQELLNIPFGKTISYAEQSKRMKNEKAIRAIASTNGKNQINIIIPCHRVIGSDGSLTGYGGDLWVKKWLLQHEEKFSSAAERQSLF